MPIYHVTSPDGHVYEVKAPDGASEQDAIAYIQQQHQAPSRNPAASALDAAQHHLLSPLHGAAQFVEHGVNAAANLLPEGNAVRGYVNRTVAADDAALAHREAAYQARTPDGAAATTGAAVGEIAPWLVAGPARALGAVGERAAALIPKASDGVRRFASLAAQGGVLGASQPVTGDGSYAGQKALQVGAGTVMGGAIPSVIGSVRGLARLAAPVVAPGRVANSQLARLYGSTPETIAALENAPQYVPGETVTAAQALQTPQAAMAEKALRNRPDLRGMFAEADNANNARRLGVVRQHAGSDIQVQQAIATRRDATKPFISEHLQPGPENTRFSRAQKGLADFIGSRPLPMPEFKILDQARLIAGQVQRGTMDERAGAKALAALKPATKAGKKALEQAMTAIDQNMVNPSRIVSTLRQLSLSGNDTVRGAARKHLSLLQEHMDASGRVPAYALDDIRQGIGSTLAASAPMGAVGSQEAALYGPVASKIVSTLDRAIPGYRDYLSAYRAGSVPINTMEASQRILAPADSGALNSAGDPVLTLNRLNTGLNRADKSRFGLDPAARADMAGVQKSLQRASVSNSITSPGSDTAYNLASDGWLSSQLYGPSMQGPTNKTRGLAALVGGFIGHQAGIPGAEAGGAALGLYINKAAEAINNRVVQRVGKGAVDSQEAARMLREFVQKQTPKNRALLLERYPQWALILGQQSLPAPR